MCTAKVDVHWDQVGDDKDTLSFTSPLIVSRAHPLVSPTMATTKRYVDRAVQTVHETPISPYYDPAIVLVATGATQLKSTYRHTSSDRSITVSPVSLHHNQDAYIHTMQPQSPTICIGSPGSLTRVNSKRKQAALDVRRPTLTADSRRVISMPENEAKYHSPCKGDPGVRVVSMPDKIKSHFRSPAESPSRPLERYSGQCGRTRTHGPSSDGPETPSPPTPYHVSGWDGQFSQVLVHGDGTLEPHFKEVEGRQSRCIYSPNRIETGAEFSTDWVAWADSPPRPIPALHGPPSLPYARCPS